MNLEAESCDNVTGGARNSQAGESRQVVQPVGEGAVGLALLPQGQVGLPQLGRGSPQQAVPQAWAGLQSLQPSEGGQSLKRPQGEVAEAAGVVVGHLLQPGKLFWDLERWGTGVAGRSLGTMGLKPCEGSQPYCSQGSCIVTGDIPREGCSDTPTCCAPVQQH